MYKLNEMESGYYNMMHESGKTYLVALTKRQAQSVFNTYVAMGFIKVELVSDEAVLTSQV